MPLKLFVKICRGFNRMKYFFSCSPKNRLLQDLNLYLLRRKGRRHMKGMYPRVFDREEKVRIIKFLGTSGFCLRNKCTKITHKKIFPLVLFLKRTKT